MEQRLQIAGWLIFLVCSALFIVPSALARDPWGTAAGLVFLVGCLVFLASLVLSGRSRG